MNRCGAWNASLLTLAGLVLLTLAAGVVGLALDDWRKDGRG